MSGGAQAVAGLVVLRGPVTHLTPARRRGSRLGGQRGGAKTRSLYRAWERNCAGPGRGLVHLPWHASTESLEALRTRSLSGGTLPLGEIAEWCAALLRRENGA